MTEYWKCETDEEAAEGRRQYEEEHSELARLRRIEEAARAVVDSEFPLELKHKGSTYTFPHYVEGLVDKLRKALEAK